MSLFLRSSACSTRLVRFAVPALKEQVSKPFSSLPVNSFLLPLTVRRASTVQIMLLPPQQLIVRFKNKHAKLGQHLERLETMGHAKEHNEAQKKRRIKKEKNQARKAKGGKTSSAEIHHGDDDQDSYQHPPEEEYDVDQTVLPDVKEVKKRMEKHIDAYKGYLKSVRGGEPTPELFDDIIVQDAYGKGTGSTPLKAVAQVVVSSPTLATATCFDPATAKAVSNAIRDKLELNPQQEEGGVVSIPMPRVSLESRQQTARNVNKRTELYRQRIRKVRQSAMDVVKQGVAGKLEGISKDDAFRVQQEIEDVTTEEIAELNDIAEKKQNEIMQV